MADIPHYAGFSGFKRGNTTPKMGGAEAVSN